MRRSTDALFHTWRRGTPHAGAGRSYWRDGAFRVLGVGEANQRRGRIGAGDLPVLAAELVEQPSLVLQLAPLRSAQPVCRSHVHANQLSM